MRYLIVTGMSGAGKTSVIHALEDLGYYCVDNLPPSLIPGFIELWHSNPGTEECVAFGVDIRSRQYFSQLSRVLDELKGRGVPVEVLFMDCRDDELTKRYKTTRADASASIVRAQGQAFGGRFEDRTFLSCAHAGEGGSCSRYLRRQCVADTQDNPDAVWFRERNAEAAYTGNLIRLYPWNSLRFGPGF